MKLIVGLGNPGPKYKNTRHNFGYMILDAFAKINGLSWRYSPDWLCYFVKNDDYILVKPTTFMNKSGEAVRTIANFYKTPPKDILVVADDLDLDFGKIRLSFDGSSAGHRGIESMIESLGTFEFGRLRAGIGREEGKDPEKYVLEDFSSSQKEKIEEILKKSSEAIQSYLNEGMEAAMNKFN